MRRLIVVLTIALCLGQGCATLAAIAPAIVTAVVRSGNIIDQIERFTDLFFDLHPSREKERKVVDEAILRARMALDAVMVAKEGAEDAMVAARKAYADLLRVVAPFGVYELTRGNPLSGGDRTLGVPSPGDL